MRTDVFRCTECGEFPEYCQGHGRKTARPTSEGIAVNAQLGEETLRTATASTAYIVVTEEYDYYRAIAVLAVEAEAKAFADDYNSRPHTWSWSRAEVESVDFYAAGWRPAPREVLDENA